MTALLSCSVSPALVFLDPYGIDCCTMKHVCFGICIICCSRYAHLPWAGCTGSSVGKQSTGWTDLFSFTYFTPVRTVSCTCHLVFTLEQSTTWRQIDCMWANVSGDSVDTGPRPMSPSVLRLCYHRLYVCSQISLPCFNMNAMSLRDWCA